MTEWKTTLKISEITNVKAANDKLEADLEMKPGEIKVYTGAKFVEGQNDYNMIDPTADGSVVANKYEGTMVANKAVAGKYSIAAAGGAVDLMAKTGKDVDDKITTKPGQDQGGQGYALELKEPKLKIKTKGTKGANYSGTMTWTLTYDDAAK